MKIGEFFKSLLSPDGEVSSKRLAGLTLVLFFLIGGTVGIINDTMSEVVESVLKTALYTGVGLLGVNVAETVFSNTKRKQPVEIKEDEESN